MHHISALLSIFLLVNALPAVNAGVVSITAATTDSPGECKEILQRKEWRDLDNSEKKDYIDAVKCLQSTPMQDSSLPAAKSVFDVFQGTHISVATKVHYVGEFIMWHRHFLGVYEKALREKCNYKGAQPYWNWSLDADNGGNISSSPIWDTETGFGGNGALGTYNAPTDNATITENRINPHSFRGCVRTGPFANLTLHMGPGKTVTDHCLTRGFNDTTRVYLNSTAVEKTMSFDKFEDFHIQLEGAPSLGDHRQHDGGHIAIGGEMSNFFSSPGDPMFYMHHGNLDRIYWQWQRKDNNKRMYAVGGPTSLEKNSTTLTPDYILVMNPTLGPNATVGSVLDTETAPNCYTYK